MNSKVSCEWIENAMRQYIRERAETHPDIAAFVELVGALPLYLDMGGGVAIRSDWELIGFLWGEPQSIEIETDPQLRFLALVCGTERYPELSAVSPQRTTRDRDCSLCNGTGEVSGAKELGLDPKILRCYCGGAGWLPANVPDPPAS